MYIDARRAYNDVMNENETTPTVRRYTVTIDRDAPDARDDLAHYANVAHATLTDIVVTDDSRADTVDLAFTATDASVLAYAFTFDATDAVALDDANATTVAELFDLDA